MAAQLDLGTLETDAPALEAPGWDTPFRFAILGDFSGRKNRELTESPDAVAERKGKKIDRENFDEVFAEIFPALTLEIKGGPKGANGTIELSFSNLDDFHADQIVAKVEKFEDLSAAKDRAALLSLILHHPDFKALEETWMGIDWFLKKAWTGENGVEVMLYDIAESELVEAVNGNDDLSQSPLYAWLVERALNGYNAQPWGAIIGLYSFEVNADNAQILGRIAKIARNASAPFLAGLKSQPWDKAFKPSKDDVAAWEALRKEPASAMLGLAAPGFLVRPPYSSANKPVEKIAYEEYKTNKDAEHYVVGNPGLFCGALLAKSFTKKNWQFKPGGELEITDMPMHVARDDDNEEVLVTVTSWLMQKAIDQCTRQGFMILRGVKGRNNVQLNRFLPLAQAPADQPAADLIGSWGQKALKGVPRTPSKMGFGAKVEVEAATTTVAGKKGKKPAAAVAGVGDTDDLNAAVDELEARLKAERDAAEAAAGGGDTPSDDFGSMDFGSDSSSDTPAEESSDLDALLAGGDTPSEEPSADPDLDAMLAGLETSTEETPAEEPAAEEEMDPELAALLKEMEEGK